VLKSLILPLNFLLHQKFGIFSPIIWAPKNPPFMLQEEIIVFFEENFLITKKFSDRSKIFGGGRRQLKWLGKIPKCNFSTEVAAVIVMVTQVVAVVRECVLRVRCRGDDVAGYDSAAGTHQSEFDGRRVAASVVARLDASLAAVRRAAEIQRQRSRLLPELERFPVKQTTPEIRHDQLVALSS